MPTMTGMRSGTSGLGMAFPGCDLMVCFDALIRFCHRHGREAMQICASLLHAARFRRLAGARRSVATNIDAGGCP
jgi:hypothetical protein